MKNKKHKSQKTIKKLKRYYQKRTPWPNFEVAFIAIDFIFFLLSKGRRWNKSLQRTPARCHELSKYNIVICVLTSEKARSIVICIAVSPRTVPLEVSSRRAAPAHIWIVESTTTAVLIRIEGQRRALACYHFAAIPELKIIRTSKVKISGTTSRGAGVSASSSNSWCHLKGNIMKCMTSLSIKNNMCWRTTVLHWYVGQKAMHFSKNLLK